jgi:hypothetical protein
MSDDVGIYGGVAYGRQLRPDRPADWLADIDSQWLATPQRLEGARRFWPQVELADFVNVGSPWRPLLRHRETGVEYRLAGHDPLVARDPSKDAVTCFVVHSGQLRVLRPRGEHVPTEVIEHGEVYAGEVRGNVLVDRKTGKAHVMKGRP